MDFLGLSRCQWEFLFTVDAYLPFGYGVDGITTPKEVAQRIRDFIENPRIAYDPDVNFNL